MLVVASSAASADNLLGLYAGGAVSLPRQLPQRVTVTSYACPPVGYGPCGPYTSRQDQSSTNFAFGVGAQARLGAFAVRAEYERISASGGDPDLLSVGIVRKL